jgi:hypothetical protein
MKDQPVFTSVSAARCADFKSSDGAIQTTFPVRWMHGGFQITHEN